MTPTPAAPDLWHISEPPPKQLPLAGPGVLVLLPERIPYQERWSLIGSWLALRQNWLTMEEFLQGSTSYGPSKAIRELAGAISSRGALHAYSVVSSPLGEIDELVDSLRTILELEQDWDGEGASPIAESTWRRAGDFLRGTASTLWNKYGLRMESPSIVPASDGSIDLHWKLFNRELLINIPAGANEQATYYGDNTQGWNSVEGKLDTNASNPWLFVWLTE